MDAVRVVVAGGSPILRAGMVASFRADDRLSLVAQARDVFEAAARARQPGCDVLVLYADEPRVEAGRLLDGLADLDPRPKILVLTESENGNELQATLRLGIKGYGVVRYLTPEECCSAIVTLAAREAWVCPLATRTLISLIVQQDHAALLPAAQRRRLSDREVNVLYLAAAGVGEKRIADQLCLSVNTVKTYLHRVCAKLDVTSRAEAIRKAMQEGIISDPRSRPI